ncbi:MAG: hypothetical protein IJD60_13105 [Clostridia bacterium]|nr:hypothetical protein [Clostridia bacterium]
MRIDILGLELDQALAVLAQEGVSPDVTITSAPRRREETDGVLRVVYADDGGRRLTVSRFLDPISAHKEEIG